MYWCVFMLPLKDLQWVWSTIWVVFRCFRIQIRSKHRLQVTSLSLSLSHTCIHTLTHVYALSPIFRLGNSDSHIYLSLSHTCILTYTHIETLSPIFTLGNSDSCISHVIHALERRLLAAANTHIIVVLTLVHSPHGVSVPYSRSVYKHKIYLH